MRIHQELLPVGGCPCRQLSQGRQESRGGLWIIERFERNRGGELGGLGPEADLQNVLLADRHQRIELRSRILFPVSSGSKNDGAGLVYIPLA